MCVVTFAGTYQNPKAESGINITKKYVGDATDSRFFKNNFGAGKMFPGGPAYGFRSKKVLCFACQSKKGNITNSILTDALRKFDNRKVYNRYDSKLPFLLLDGHGSCAEYEFLECTNDDKCKWVISLGVPHGRALQQVGDSAK